MLVSNGHTHDWNFEQKRSEVCVDKILASDAQLDAIYGAESVIQEGIEGLSKGAIIDCIAIIKKFSKSNITCIGYSFCAMHMGYNGSSKDRPFGVILQQLESVLKTVEDPRVTFG